MLSSPARVLLLVIGCAVLRSLESVMPLYRLGGHRLRRALPNIGLSVLLLLTNLALSFAVAAVAGYAHRVGMRVAGWVGVVIGIAALDFFAYVAHVLLHKMPVGWRFHRVHHSDEAVDVTTAFRQHPGETVWRVVWQLPAILLFGLPLWVVAVYLTISAANAQLEHANVRLGERLDRVLRLLFVTPNMHKVHHSCIQRETDSNYSNIFSVWDRLFGTYTRRVDFEKLRYGLDAKAEPGLRALLAMPFAG
ncbi:MAG TPA: sterol desaturase family protein [Thermoanaerobaculia bacterium]|nr:sterol desaturase family protein [Thermoanaerobaculia bacterium]